MVSRLREWAGSRRRLAALLAVCIVGFGLRLAYAVETPVAPVRPDAPGYARIARELFEHGRYAQTGPHASKLQPAMNYSPGLPFFVAGIYEIEGQPDQTAARVVLALLGGLSIPLAFALGRRLGGPDAGLIASVPVAIYPAILQYQGMLMTEPLAATLIGGAVLCVVRADRSDAIGWWIGAALLGSALAMVHPEYLFVAAGVPVVAVIRIARRGGPRRALVVGAVTVLAAACFIAPWTIRNYLVLHRFVPISTGGGQALFEGSYIDAGPYYSDLEPTILAQHPWLRRRLRREGALRAPGGGSYYVYQVVGALARRAHPDRPADEALAAMGRHAYLKTASDRPLALAGFLAEKAGLAWANGARSVMQRTGWMIFHRVFIALALVGLIIGLATRRFEFIIIAAIFAAATLVQAIFVSSPRRTIVLLPLISALAGVGAAWAASRAYTGARSLRLAFAQGASASEREPAAPSPE